MKNSFMYLSPRTEDQGFKDGLWKAPLNTWWFATAKPLDSVLQFKGTSFFLSYIMHNQTHHEV